MILSMTSPFFCNTISACSANIRHHMYVAQSGSSLAQLRRFQICDGIYFFEKEMYYIQNGSI